MEQIAHRIREARLRAGLTQNELATLVGVTSVTPSRWERGINRPFPRQVRAIAEATGTSVNDLLADEAAVVTGGQA